MGCVVGLPLAGVSVNIGSDVVVGITCVGVAVGVGPPDDDM